MPRMSRPLEADTEIELKPLKASGTLEGVISEFNLDLADLIKGQPVVTIKENRKMDIRELELLNYKVENRLGDLGDSTITALDVNSPFKEEEVESTTEQSAVLIAIEELNELVQAITKLARYDVVDDYDVKRLEKLRDNLHEEFADVEIVLNWIYKVFGMDAEKLTDWETKKIKRIKKHVKAGVFK